MMKPLRLLVAAAALNVTIGAAVATAQTVIVRKVPAGDTIELFLNTSKVATATVDANGDATLPLNLRETNAGKTDIDANVFVEACDKLRRVLVVERGQPAAAPQAGCDRREILGLYVVRRDNTLVVDAGGANPTMMMVKGSYGLGPEKPGPRAPKGLVLFGGGGLADFRDAVAISCGTASPCDGKNAGLTYVAGATVWLTRFLAAEGTYIKPRNATASGSGTDYNFNSTLDAQVITITGRIGIPAGPVRLSGFAGTNYHDALLTTKETIKDQSQTMEVETRGWGWVFGAGLEIWTAPAFALYADAGIAGLRGVPVGGGEVRFNDRLRYVTIGARVRIGR
jgi:hypothetical protein